MAFMCGHGIGRIAVESDSSEEHGESENESCDDEGDDGADDSCDCGTETSAAAAVA